MIKLFVLSFVGVFSMILFVILPPTEYPNRLENIIETNINNEFYDSLEFANSWNNSKSWAQGLHVLNPTRLSYLLNFFEKKNLHVSKSSKILDIGCGGGILTNKLGNQNFSNLHGIDLSKNSVIAAKKESVAQNLKIEYKQGSIYKIPYGNQEFDFIILADILDHLSDLRLAMKEVKRVLKSNGFVFFETIDRNFMSNLVIKVLGEAFGIIPKNTHDYRLFVKPNELKQLFEEFQFDILDIKGVVFKIGFNENFYPMVYNSTLNENIQHVYLGYAQSND
eukprot:gene11635-4876_t